MSSKPLPPVNAETKPFWDGCNEGRLLIQCCRACGHRQFYPRLLCTACSARTLDWIAASGDGRVRTFTIIRRAVSEAFEPDVPYVVALIELAEGPCMMSNVVDCDPQAVHTGMAVTLQFERRSDAIAVPQFRPR